MKIMMKMKKIARNIGAGVKQCVLKTEPGIDGILVTVGLCIIALILCVVMKDSMSEFVKTLVEAMTVKAQQILTGVTG